MPAEGVHKIGLPVLYAAAGSGICLGILAVDPALYGIQGIPELEYGRGAVFQDGHFPDMHGRQRKSFKTGNGFHFRGKEAAAQAVLQKGVHAVERAPGMDARDAEPAVIAVDDKPVICKVRIRHKARGYARVPADKNNGNIRNRSSPDLEGPAGYPAQIAAELFGGETFRFRGIHCGHNGDGGQIIPEDHVQSSP